MFVFGPDHLNYGSADGNGCCKIYPLDFEGDKKQQNREKIKQHFHGLASIEYQGRRVDAKAQSAGWGAIRKYMSKMRTAMAAVYLIPAHTVRGIAACCQTVRLNGLIEAGPTAAGFKFVASVKQRFVAACTLINSLVVAIPVFSCKRGLSAALAANAILLRGERGSPLGIGFCNSCCHLSIHE